METSKDHLKLGSPAPDFKLKGIDGKIATLASFQDAKVLVVMFTCNHCPYVQAYEPRLIAIQRDYADQKVRLVAINANETKNYPEDSFDKMVVRAREMKYNFSYLRDETQGVATAYGAACTPEVFVFGPDRRLKYHGRIDDNYRDPKAVKSYDLRRSIDAVLAGHDPQPAVTQAIGCSIKWSG
jgi:thiol-disulfide isomerase/thioredoxin